ncbi:MAG TPA: hypothetical protein VE986_10290 [Hyphomicrobiales bacterium]|nr:hypothetical protein [Hyphomicrobiales bacterium]
MQQKLPDKVGWLGMNTPEYWHDRAEEILVRLEHARNQNVRSTLLRIYADYLRLARLATERARLEAFNYQLTGRP